MEFAGFLSGRFEAGASGSVAFELLRERTYLSEEVSRDDGQGSEAATVVDVDPGLVGTLGPGEVFYRPSHGMTTGRLGACRGRWSFLLARHAQDGAVLVLAVGGDAIGDGGAAGAPGWGWCGLGSGLGDFRGLSRCDQRG